MLGILCKVSISWITLYEAFGRLRATLVSLLGSEVISPVALIKGLVQIDTAMTDLKNYWVFQQGLFGAAVLWTLFLVTVSRFNL